MISVITANEWADSANVPDPAANSMRTSSVRESAGPGLKPCSPHKKQASRDHLK